MDEDPNARLTKAWEQWQKEEACLFVPTMKLRFEFLIRDYPKVPPGHKQRLLDLIETLRDADKTGDDDTMTWAMEQFDLMIIRLESNKYK